MKVLVAGVGTAGNVLLPGSSISRAIILILISAMAVSLRWELWKGEEASGQVFFRSFGPLKKRMRTSFQSFQSLYTLPEHKEDLRERWRGTFNKGLE